MGMGEYKKQFLTETKKTREPGLSAFWLSMKWKWVEKK